MQILTAPPDTLLVLPSVLLVTLGAVLTLAGGMLIRAVAGRRLSRRMPQPAPDIFEDVTLQPEQLEQPEQPAGRVTGHGDPAEAEMAAAPRALMMYVRALESTLGEQDQRLHDLARAADQQLDQTLLRDRERVYLTVTALRASLAEESGAVALNRIETALSRLGAGPGAVRPLLTRDPSGSLPVRFVVSTGDSGAGSVAEEPRPEEQHSEPPHGGIQPPEHPDDSRRFDPTGTGTGTGTDTEELPSEDSPSEDGPAPPAVHKVMPVPAPIMVEAPARSRRGIRWSRAS